MRRSWTLDGALFRCADAFAAEWDEAVDEGTDVLEDVAFRRAVDGSDRLLIFLLKARRPEKFRDGYEGADAGLQRDQHIAEAIDRFTGTVIQRALSASRAPDPG